MHAIRLAAASILCLAIVPSPRPDPRTILDRSAAAMGGLTRLSQLSVKVEEAGVEYLVSIPTAEGRAARMAVWQSTQFRDHRHSTIRWEREVRYPMRAAPIRQTVVATERAAFDPGRSAPGSAAVWLDARNELDFAPEQVILTALAGDSLTDAGPGMAGGEMVRRIRFRHRGLQAELAVSLSSRLPVSLRLVSGDPGDPVARLWGGVHEEIVWTGWSLDSTGIWYPRQRALSLNGDRWRELVVTGLALNPPEAESLTIPDSIAAAFRAALAPPAVRLTPRLLEQDVVLYFGGYQSFAVRQPDGIVVVEAPESNEKSRAILDDLARRWPGTPVKAVVVTSPMWLHLGGVREYVARGVPVFTGGATWMVERLVSTPRAVIADSLSQRPRRLRLTTVREPLTLGSGPSALRLLPATGPHGASMLLVEQPARRRLYTSDLLVPDVFEPVFSAAYRAETEATVTRLRLTPDTVFGLHLGPTAWSDVLAGAELVAARAGP